jgi:hypothetical protein
MTEKKAPEKTARRQRLTLAFLQANLGPLILGQLAEDSTCARVFPQDIFGKIQQYKENPDAQMIAPVMKAFLDNACPSVRSNQIVNWVCKQYLSHRHNGKPIQAEDLYKVEENLKYFDQLKNSPAFKESGAEPDLFKYKTYAEFESMLDPFLKRKAGKEILAEEFNMTPQERVQLLAETTILYQGPEGKVVVPHTPNASKYWGSNTKWCISGKEYADSLFPHYNKEFPIIMMLPADMPDKKIALANKTLWNSADETIKGLPQAHHTLMSKCLAGLSEGAREIISQWISDSARRIAEEGTDLPEQAFKGPWEEELSKECKKIQQGEYEDLDKKLWTNKDFVLTALRRNGLLLEHVPQELKRDREVVLTAVEGYDHTFYFAPEDLKSDRTFVLIVVQKKCEALAYAAKHLKSDADFVHKCLTTQDELAFMIEGMSRRPTFLEGANVWQPDERSLKEYQIQALDRMIEKGDIGKFRKHTRHFKLTWGDPDTLFAADPAATLAKIKAALAIEHPPVKNPTVPASPSAAR